MRALPSEMFSFYNHYNELQRLSMRDGQLEFARTCELLNRFLPPAPAVVFDVGGGPGAYACWLARQDYEVHLIDAMPRHVAQAEEASQAQPEYPLASAAVGDARHLEQPDASADAVLLLGPLYHLIQPDERLTALREARRVLRNGGPVLAVGISRFASTLEGLFGGLFDDPEFVRIAQRDLVDGQHRNTSPDRDYFTTTFFHHPDELKAEVEAAGLNYETTLAIEGPGWLLQNFDAHWNDLERREQLLNVVRSVEAEPTMLGASAHMMVVAHKA